MLNQEILLTFDKAKIDTFPLAIFLDFHLFCIEEEVSDCGLCSCPLRVRHREFHQGRFAGPRFAFNPQDTMVFMDLVHIEPLIVGTIPE